jgi:hypothetical protein
MLPRSQGAPMTPRKPERTRRLQVFLSADEIAAIFPSRWPPQEHRNREAPQLEEDCGHFLTGGSTFWWYEPVRGESRQLWFYACAPALSLRQSFMSDRDLIEEAFNLVAQVSDRGVD